MQAARIWTLSVAAVVAGAWACNPLFGQAIQCKTDRECERFGGAVCAADGICVAAESGTSPSSSSTTPPVRGGSTGGSTPSSSTGGAPDASTSSDASAIDPCSISPKLAVPLPGTKAIDGSTGLVLGADVTLGCDKDYILQGEIFVDAGVTLTIDAGTTLLGDVASRGGLIVRPGGRIVARGTAAKPIVFTSSQPADQRLPGDWRGLALLGTAPPTGSTLPSTNWAYGGTEPDASSGVLAFVRVEYSARGLELAGVGRKTELDSVQVRKSADNCFSFYGGTVRGKHLACQYPADEMYELSRGYDGALQFVVGQRTPVRDYERNGLLVDAASVAVRNATFCGSDVRNDSFALVARSGGKLVLENALLESFGAGFDVQNPPGDPLSVRTSTFFGMFNETYAYAEDVAVTNRSSFFYNDDNGFDERAFLQDPARKNDAVDPQTPGCTDPANPRFHAGAMLSATAPPDDGFFDPTATYRGGTSATDTWPYASWLVWSSK